MPCRPTWQMGLVDGKDTSLRHPGAPAMAEALLKGAWIPPACMDRFPIGPGERLCVASSPLLCVARITPDGGKGVCLDQIKIVRSWALLPGSSRPGGTQGNGCESVRLPAAKGMKS